jgi:hypothetical protein
MGCDWEKGPDGATYVICSRSKHPGSRTRCCGCGRLGSPLLCDGRAAVPGKTCDAPLCRDCASHVGRDRDLCPWCVNVARSAR